MVHALVLAGFSSVTFSALVSYQLYGYAFLVAGVFGPLCVLNIVTHARRPVALTAVTAALVLCLCVLIFQRASKLDAEHASGFAFEDTYELNEFSVVEDYPNYMFSGNRYVVHVSGTEARILLQTQPYQRFGYADIVFVSARLRDVREQGSEWLPYYRKLGVHYTTFSPDVSLATRTEQRPLFAERTMLQDIRIKLFEFKMAIRSRVLEKFSSHASSLVLGMLLGERDELSREEKDMFNQVGLSHILVVSGYNISLMISFVFIVLKPVPKVVRICTALSVIGLFVLLIGYEPSVVRAALMGSIIVFAKVARRPGSALNVLFLVATVMLCINPYGIFDAGLHLSFIATFSLLVMPDLKKVPEFVAVTAWVFACVAPYIMYLSGSVSFAGIVTNMAVTLLLSFFMLASLLSVTLSFFNISLGADVLLIETASRYVFSVSRAASHISPIMLNIPPSLVTAGYACACALVLFRSSRYAVGEFIERRYQRYVPQRPS